MEGDERRQGSSSHDPTLERRAPDSGGLTSTDQLHEESTSNASLNSATCGVGTTEASSTLAGPSLAAEAGEVLVDNAMGLQDHGSTIQFRVKILMVAYIIQSHTRVPGHWWLLGVIYQDVEDEDYEDDSDDSDDSEDDMHLVNDNTSYGELRELGEHIGNVSNGLREEVIMAKLKRHKYSCSTMGYPVDAETCCICQEEYADDEDVGKLDCGHEYHVVCIKEWLSKKNSCPICKKTALAA
ncbi:E3 ubiquitin-protein ligase MBR2 [Vitis vinifera]|uniref:RING-type E3 ubiquitin transferase n=1 Tax=Vitis vinifera TaxID=29760 RepID=A0A438KK11_VITVI|nr:E3 ubiquitin-protein ligase MBR2 [Vitis vinifera]